MKKYLQLYKRATEPADRGTSDIRLVAPPSASARVT